MYVYIYNAHVKAIQNPCPPELAPVLRTRAPGLASSEGWTSSSSSALHWEKRPHARDKLGPPLTIGKWAFNSEKMVI